MATSTKHDRFVREPMGDKPVGAVAGIDDNLAKALTAKGYDKANTLLGQYLILHKSEEGFTQWFKKEFKTDNNTALVCFQCLDKWSEFIL